MDKELLAKFQSVVNSFNQKNFSSHDFLKKFIDMYEDDYREIFTKNTLQSTNAQIARMGSVEKYWGYFFSFIVFCIFAL